MDLVHNREPERSRVAIYLTIIIIMLYDTIIAYIYELLLDDIYSPICLQTIINVDKQNVIVTKTD